MPTIEEAKEKFPPGTLFDNNNIKPKVSYNNIVRGNHRYAGDDIIVDNLNGCAYTIYCSTQKEWAYIVQSVGEVSPGNFYSIY